MAVLDKEICKEIFYDGAKAGSYNAFLNFVLGARSTGKTYFYKCKCIKDFKKSGKQFIYLRRFESEIKNVNKLFNDIINDDVFPDDKITCDGRVFKLNGEPMGYAICISKGLTLKGVSYDKVYNIIFDEFIIDEKKSFYRYLPDEVNNFLDIVSTVLRLRDGKVFLLSNTISYVNPYFCYRDWNIKVNPKKKYQTFKNGMILIEQYENNDFVEYAQNNSPLGRLTKGTQYGNYAFNNKVLRDDTTFIKKKNNNKYTHIKFNIKIGGSIYGVWEDNKNGEIFINKQPNKEYPIFCLSRDDMSPNMLLMTTNNYSMKLLRQARNLGVLYYENVDIKYHVLEYLN